MNLKEGGNVFKGADGEALTQRINQTDVKPTLAWLEQMLPGLDVQGNTLGSTGIKPTSGDLDVAVDSSQLTKLQLTTRLQQWAQSHGLKPEDYVKQTGAGVHFKTPIAGTPAKGYVQTDFMFLKNIPWSKFVLGPVPADSQYKGRERNILMNSMAKALGYKLNQLAGIADRTTNEIITDDPDQVAKLLLNKSATRDDLASVESILAALAKDPKREEKLADFKAHMEREGLPFMEGTDTNPYKEVSEVNFLARLRDRIVNQGMQPLVEAASPRIEHLEDLVFEKGSRGIQEAIAIIEHAAENTAKTTTVKWDGCIHPDHVLQTNNGELRIEDIIIQVNAGEHLSVLSHDFHLGENVMSKVVNAVIKIGEKIWVEIVLDNGDTIRLTEDHEVYTTNRGWVEAKDLTDADDIKEL